jgi:hypothetical protein
MGTVLCVLAHATTHAHARRHTCGGVGVCDGARAQLTLSQPVVTTSTLRRATIRSSSGCGVGWLRDRFFAPTTAGNGLLADQAGVLSAPLDQVDQLHPAVMLPTLMTSGAVQGQLTAVCGGFGTTQQEAPSKTRGALLPSMHNKGACSHGPGPSRGARRAHTALEVAAALCPPRAGRFQVRLGLVLSGADHQRR